MPSQSSDQERRRERARRYSSESDEGRAKRDRSKRRRSVDKQRYSERDSKRPEDGSLSGGRMKDRSRSPREDRPRMRRRYSSESHSPERRHRSSRDDRRKSRRDRSESRSPPPKRRGHDHRRYSSRTRHPREDDRRSSHTHDRRNPSPPPRSGPPPPTRRSHAPLPSQQAAFTKSDDPSTAVIKPEPDVEKQKPNYAPTGKLAAETNTVANTTIVLKYNEPPEARLPPPSAPWRLYIFKGSDLLETLPLHERSCWLFGRERAVVDFPTEHPSCSKQHAVLQFRYVEKKNEWGEKKGGVKPYMIDLESANGTRINGKKMPERRYVEVMSGDVMALGESTREYVLMLPPKE